MESCSEFFNKRGSTRFRVGIPAHFSTCWRLNVYFLMIFRPTCINLLLRTLNWYSSRLPSLLIEAEKNISDTCSAQNHMGDYVSSTFVIVFFFLLNPWRVHIEGSSINYFILHFLGREVTKCDTVWRGKGKVGVLTCSDITFKIQSTPCNPRLYNLQTSIIRTPFQN